MTVINKKVTPSKIYQIDEAIKLLKELSNLKFIESIDVVIRLGVDPRKSDQIVRGATTLPAGLGKQVRVAVIADGDAGKEAIEAGADLVGTDDIIEQIKKGNIDFDVLIAAPASMGLVGQVGRLLGPRGLMPNPKTGTVTPNVGLAVKNSKSGQIKYRTDKAGLIHGSIGKASFEPKDIKANLNALITDLKKAKPATAKGTYLKKIVLSTTMGPGLVLDIGSIEVSP